MRSTTRTNAKKDTLTDIEAFQLLLSFLELYKEYDLTEALSDDLALPFYQNRWKALLNIAKTKNQSF